PDGAPAARGGPGAPGLPRGHPRPGGAPPAGPAGDGHAGGALRGAGGAGVHRGERARAPPGGGVPAAPPGHGQLRRPPPVRGRAREGAVPGDQRRDHGGDRPSPGRGRGRQRAGRPSASGFHDRRGRPGRSNSLNGGTRGMDQFTHDPEAHATARHGGGSGTGASPMEAGEGPIRTTDRTPAPARPIAGGSAPESTGEEIEDLYERSLQDLAEGEVVRGTIVGVKGTEVLVDVGYKSEGTIPIEEFHRSGVTPEVGQEIEVYLEAKEDSEGLIVLSKEKADKIKVWDVITKAYEKGAPVEGRIVEVVKGGLAVDVGVKAFLPGSQVDLRPVKNLASLIGQQIKARVIKFNRRRGNVVLSRRVVLEEEREEKRKHTLAVLHEGMVLTGVVKNITDYGAFIDLRGVDGLLHITDMSWGRISHPSELVEVGDQLEVVVLHFDRESGRVSLGHKQKGPDPWETVEERFPVGSRHRGKVVSLTNYGAFVELDRGVEGLVHVSEMSWTRRVRHPSKLVNVG